MKLSDTFKQKCENISTSWRERLHLRVFDPLPCSRLVEELEASLIAPNELKTAPPKQIEHLLKNNSWSAGIISREPLWILYNSKHAVTRHEANIMHEFGHVFLDHPALKRDPLTGLPIREPIYEDEATYLGSCLQIPRRGLAWAIQKKMSITDIAMHFGSSQKMVKFRADMTGLRVTMK